jgi:hypothetical protein
MPVLINIFSHMSSEEKQSYSKANFLTAHSHGSSNWISFLNKDRKKQLENNVSITGMMKERAVSFNLLLEHWEIT